MIISDNILITESFIFKADNFIHIIEVATICTDTKKKVAENDVNDKIFCFRFSTSP